MECDANVSFAPIPVVPGAWRCTEKRTFVEPALESADIMWNSGTRERRQLFATEIEIRLLIRVLYKMV
jgi:hypothetical protein